MTVFLRSESKEKELGFLLHSVFLTDTNINKINNNIDEGSEKFPAQPKILQKILR